MTKSDYRTVDLEEQQDESRGEDERITLQQQRGNLWRHCNLTTTAVCLLLVLVGADVAQRIMESVKYPLRNKWIPTVDILNASGMQDLKFNGQLGDYGLQGLATSPNGTLLYEFHTMSVRVLEMGLNGKIVAVKHAKIFDGSADFPPLDNNLTVSHIGGIDFCDSTTRHGAEVWLATHSDGIYGKGGLFAVDATTLQVKRSRAVQHDVNLDWVAHFNGVLYYGEFFNVKLVHRVSVDTLEPLSDLVLSLPDHLSNGGINYVQSAAFDLEGRLVLLGDDYQCTIYMLDPSTGDFVGSQALLLGSETDGITFDRTRQRMLVGFNRQHSHEQVMQMEPMVSIIQHERL